MAVSRQRSQWPVAPALTDAAGDLHNVDVINLVSLAVQVMNLARQVDQLLRKLPGLEDLVPQHRLELLDHVMQANRVGQQFVVLFGIDEYRQRANLVDQPTQGGLVRLEGVKRRQIS